jgi:rSAM/selenodomain-associated transferase 2
VNPALSIIIPTLNDAPRLERLLSSILTNARPEIECIVCDGGSSDNIDVICKKFNVKLVQTASSRAVQMNAGVQRAKAEYLYFLHADTIPPENYYHHFLEVKKMKKMAACYQSNFEGGPFMLKLNQFFTQFKWLVSRGGDQSLFISKELFAEIGPYDENMEVMEEYPLIEKLLKSKRLHVFPQGMLISTRKYNNNSWLKVSKANYRAFKEYQKGVDSATIRKNYLAALNP